MTFVLIYAMVSIICLCIFLARRSQKNTNSDVRNNTFASKYFNINISTLDLVLLSMPTLGLSFWYAAYQIGKGLYAHNNQAKHLPIFAILMPVITLWEFFVVSFICVGITLTISDITVDEYNLSLSIISIATNIGGLINYILMLCFSLQSRKYIDRLLAENSISQPQSTFLCIIFPIIYQYYIIYNAESRFAKKDATGAKPVAQPQEEKFTQLEKLAKLKEEGILSEEEFIAEKKKLLS